MSTVPTDFRPARKLLRAIAELHTRGYQRLRIMPHLAPVGAWRCVIAPAAVISSRHGARLADGDTYHDWATYSSAGGREYRGWSDAQHCSPAQLAEVFLERRPDIAATGYGEDWLYAGWYQHMLHLTYPDALPIAFGDYVEASSFIATVGRECRIPLPPAGFAADARPGSPGGI